MSSYGFTDGLNLMGAPECAVDFYLDSIFDVACKPICVPFADHMSLNDSDVLWTFTNPVANHTLWKDSNKLEACEASEHPFMKCGIRGCLDAFQIYQEYHYANVTSCIFHDQMYQWRAWLHSKLQNICVAHSTMSNLTSYQDFTFDSQKWEKVLQAEFISGYPVPLLRESPDLSLLAGDFMRHTSKVCKHIYEYDNAELQAFFKDIGTPNRVSSLFQGMDGKSLIQMKASDLAQLGVSPTWYIPFLSHMKKYLAASLPKSFDSVGNASTIQASFYVESIYNIDEENYTFEAQFQIIFVWTDIDAWTTCKAEIMNDGRIYEVGDTCKHLWQPRLKFENAREVQVVSEHMWSEADIKLRGSVMLVRGKFFTAMDFQKVGNRV